MARRAACMGSAGGSISPCRARSSKISRMCTPELEPNHRVTIRDVENLAGACMADRKKLCRRHANRNLVQEIIMMGKLVVAVTFVGVAILAVPASARAAMDEVSAQGGMSMPGTGTAQGPIVKTPRAHKRHA